MTAENGTQYRVRLADVDAPERDEVGYAEAREYLNFLANGKTVYLEVDDARAIHRMTIEQETE